MTPANQHTGIERLSDELLPCPFCGSDDLRLTTSPVDGMSWVACRGCGLEAPSETGVDDAQAVAYWNRRALSLRAYAEPQEPVASDGWGWVEVRIDTQPDKDGWCFCTPAGHPDDGERWNERGQFFGRVSTTHPHSSSAVDGRVTEEMVRATCEAQNG